MTYLNKWCGVAALTLASALTAAPATAEPVAPVLVRPALPTRFASNCVLVDIARAGKRLVAVGERGVVVISDDDGRSWRQSSVPVSVTLTAVQFVDAQTGWAVGHSGVVLHSRDGGLTWTKQLDGVQAAELILRDAAAANASTPTDETLSMLKLARQFVADGPDKPFLNLWFSDAKNGYVVGAYGLIFRTDDGGQSWRPWLSHVDNPKGLNIYGVQTDGTTVYLAGEQGFFARSNDTGTSFRRIATPGAASYFAMLAQAGGHVAIAGLGGNLFESADQGQSWRSVTAGNQASISAILQLDDGRLAFAGQNGGLLVEQSWLTPAAEVRVTHRRSLNSIAQAADGRLVTVGFQGVGTPYEIAGAAQASKGEGN